MSETNTNCSTYSIPLKTAVEYTANWRKQHHHIKAFTVNVQELQDIIDELNSIANITVPEIRIYFGRNSEGQEKLVLVGVDQQGSDIVGFVNSQGLEQSGTYDFTRPCPGTCDTESVLYDDGNN